MKALAAAIALTGWIFIFAGCGGSGGDAEDRTAAVQPACLARDAAGNCTSVDLNEDGRPDVTCDASGGDATADNGSTARGGDGGECNIFFPEGDGNVGGDQDNSVTEAPEEAPEG